ncbi:MAG: hypothetical protein K6G51_06910, partial [Sphaerochaetaceae bacterium]|nr:hypothetical protein [Sphaerochaetaceae bacterium]
SMIGFFIYLELIHYKDYLKLIKSLLKLVMINIPLLIYLVLYLHFQNYWWESGSNLKNLLYVAFYGSISCIITLIFYIIFKVPFLEAIFKKHK